jgi:Holliday junction resolvase
MTNPKGASFERLVADYLAPHLGEDVDRQVKTGSADKGDIRGVKAHGQRVAVECKNTTRLNLAAMVNEAEVERVNLGALAGLAVHKRTGKGKAQMGQQYVTMTLADLVALLTGTRP